ncbi:MAG: transglycosylase domain-containing protein [Butyrivibrio sp.]|nr:transglycosylase domain-containing protein [Butyrivibrio sp.]
MRKTRLQKKDLYPTRFETHVMDAEDRVIRILAENESHRDYVPLGQMSDYLVQGIVAGEDKRYYRHHGVDFIGMARSFVIIVKSFGRRIQGGSTITQQLVKNTLYPDWVQEHTFVQRLQRKVGEFFLALRVERMMDKSEILECYLNTIYFGGGCYGAETASLRYFGKHAADLDLAESTLLAGIPQNPYGCDPFRHPEKSIGRRNYILRVMLKEGIITKEQHDQVVRTDITEQMQQRKEEIRQVFRVYSYYEDALITQVTADLMEQRGITRKEATQMIYSGGLRIHTPQLTQFQQFCENLFCDPALIPDMEKPYGPQAAMILLDPATGYVLATVGGRGEKQASRIFHRGTDARRNHRAKIIERFFSRLRQDAGEGMGISIMDLCAAYAAHENGGAPLKPYFYEKVTDWHGNVLLSATSPERREMTDYPMPDCSEVAMPGDVWVIGMVAGLVLGVWGGYDDNRRLPLKEAYFTYPRKLWEQMAQKIKDYKQTT